MKGTISTRRAALSELFKGIKLASSKSGSRTGAGETEKWQIPAPLTREESNLAGMLNKYLESELEKNSSKSPVTDHFLDLFTGLNIISSSPTSKHGRLHDLNDLEKISFLSKCLDSQELKEVFDELYYHGRLSRAVASCILKNKAFKDIEHVSQLINGRGNLLGWTIGNCFTFQLQIANKYFMLGEYEKAKSQVIDGFEGSWVPVVESGLISNGVLQGLTKAVLLFKREDLLVSMVKRWNKGDEKVLKRMLAVWIEARKQNAENVVVQVVETGLNLSQANFDEYHCLLFKSLDHLGDNTDYQLLLGDGVLVKLADLACSTQSRPLYELLKEYLDGLILKSDYSETLSTALAFQKLESFKHDESVQSVSVGEGTVLV